MSNKSLSISEVKECVYSYQEPEVTDQLYAFGSLLLEEIQDRSKQVDGKAVTVLGWSLAILAFWFTQTKNIGNWIEFLFAASSAVLAAIATVFAYRARVTRGEWAWPSDKDWFQAVREGVDELKRFHVRSMHVSKRAQQALTERKAGFLFWSEAFLTSAALVLAGAALLKLATFVTSWIHPIL